MQFGFININDKDRIIIKKNYELLENKKVSDFDKDIFIHKKYKELYDQNKNMNIRNFVKLLCNNNCERFVRYYDRIYYNFGLKKVISKQYELILNNKKSSNKKSSNKKSDNKKSSNKKSDNKKSSNKKSSNKKSSNKSSKKLTRKLYKKPITI